MQKIQFTCHIKEIYSDSKLRVKVISEMAN